MTMSDKQPTKIFINNDTLAIDYWNGFQTDYNTAYVHETLWNEAQSRLKELEEELRIQDEANDILTRENIRLKSELEAMRKPGYVLVPEEPTEEMETVAYDFLKGNQLGGCGCRPDEIYTAMISATKNTKGDGDAP